MGSQFSMSRQTKNRQPAGGATRIDVPAELARLPSGFAYAVAGHDHREHAVRVHAALLAEEVALGLSTQRMDFVERIKGHALTAGEREMRRQFEAGLQADDFLAEHADEIEALPQKLAEADKSLALADAALIEAQRRRDAAAAKVDQARRFAKQVEDARRATNPSDPAVVHGLMHARSLRAN